MSALPNDTPSTIGPKPSSRGQVPSFLVMEVIAKAASLEAAGEKVFHLEVGQPSLGAPAKVIEVAQQGIAREEIGYTPICGLPALRERIAAHYADWYGVHVDPAQVVVTVGASGAFTLAFLAMFETGARIGLPIPGYPPYANTLKVLGFEPVSIRVDSKTRFQLTADLLARCPERLDGIILASPSNPCGTMLDKGQLEEIVAWCRESATGLIVDEIYHGLCFDVPMTTVLEIAPEAVVVNSFSKYFAMTGWRLGWLVAPMSLQPTIEDIAGNMFISAPTPSQLAAIEAFNHKDELNARNAMYARNRQCVLAALSVAGLHKIAPADGAFYVYLDIAELGLDSAELCQRLMDEERLAITTGYDFDLERGGEFMRLSYACGEQDIAEAMRRLVGWVKRRRQAMAAGAA